MPRQSMCSLSFKVSPLKPWLYFSSPWTCCMPRPSHPTERDHPCSIWWGVKIKKLLIMQVSPVSCYTFHALYTLPHGRVSNLRLHHQWKCSSSKGAITDNPKLEASLCVSTCSNRGHHLPAVLDPLVNANFSRVINKLLIKSVDLNCRSPQLLHLSVLCA